MRQILISCILTLLAVPGIADTGNTRSGTWAMPSVDRVAIGPPVAIASLGTAIIIDGVAYGPMIIVEG